MNAADNLGDLLDPNVNPTLPVTAAMAVLKVSRSTAYELARTGVLPVIHLNGSRMVLSTARLREMVGLPPVGTP